MQTETDTLKHNPTPAKPSRIMWVVRLIIQVLCVTAIALAFSTWRAQQKNQAQLTNQLEQINQQTQSLTQRLATATQQNITNETRINALEQRLREAVFQHSQNVPATVEGAHEAALWFELQTRIHTAYQRALLSGEDAALLQVLHDVKQRSANHSNPQFSLLHQSVTKDIAALQHAPRPSRKQLAAQLNVSLQQLQQLPLLSQQIPKLNTDDTAPKSPKKTPQSSWTRFTQQLRQGLGQLVRVRTISATDSALISPEMARFVREHTRLRIINARLALLLGQYATAHDDIQAAIALLERYFDTEAATVQATRTSLNQIAQQLNHAKTPSIDSTLAALRLPNATQQTLGN